MKVVFDQGTPAPLRTFLSNHEVSTSFDLGWAALNNGDLLAAAEREGFHLLITTDQNLQYQQNLKGRRIAIIVLLSTSWPRIRNHVDAISAAVNSIQSGDYSEISIP